jgi:steroid delta-isomerase-like uncharacterized protein
VSADDNKALIRRWIEAYNDRDEQAEAHARAPDYVAHVPGGPGPLNSEQWTQFLAGFSEGFPDLRLTPQEILAEGDMVAARVDFDGIHAGRFAGVPPTHKRVAFSSIEINRIVDGKVVEHWVQLDRLEVLQQLGVAPSEPNA